MIIINKTSISSINYGKVALSAVYHGATLVWQAIRSCFGTGVWISDKPWIGTDGWKYKQ
jgi:hypothetical protein